MLKLTTDKHEASRGLSATAELLVVYNSQQQNLTAIPDQNLASIASSHVVNAATG